MPIDVELALDARAALGEGAIWNARTHELWWVDIDGGLVHVFDPARGHDRALSVGQPVGTIVPRARGGAVVALRDGFAALDMDTGALGFIADPEAHLPGNRFNDGKCDPAGRLWAGTLGDAPAALYRLDPDLRVHRVLAGVAISNGIAWSLDGRTMYYIDSPRAEVAAFDHDEATGAVSNRRGCITVPEECGLPDGCTLDADGRLWVAHWDGGAVICYDPQTGRSLVRIGLPVSRPTSCAFGGPDLETLYITSATTGLSPAQRAAQPLAGGLFRCRPGARGLPAFEFAG